MCGGRCFKRSKYQSFELLPIARLRSNIPKKGLLLLMKDRVTSPDKARALLELGDRLLEALNSGDQEIDDKLESYVDSFQDWFDSLPTADGGGGVVFSAEDAETGRRIAEQHATVLALLESSMRDAKRAIGDLRGWSKGIRAYVDHLPKKLSTIKTREG
jgi:hypothetical protein